MNSVDSTYCYAADQQYMINVYSTVFFLLVKHSSALFALRCMGIEGENDFIFAANLTDKPLCLTELKHKKKQAIRRCESCS